MPKLAPLWITDPISYLVWQRYPPPSIMSLATSRAQNVSASSKAREEAVAAADAYREELKMLSAEELHTLVSEARTIENTRIAASKKRVEEQRFFNQPCSEADFKYWAKMSYWSLDEFVALSLGRNPNVVNWTSVAHLVSESDFAGKYAQQRALVERAKAMGQLWDQTFPYMAIAWARRMKFDYPEQLSNEVEELGIQICDWKSLYDLKQELNSKLEAEIIKAREAHLQEMREGAEFLNTYVAKTTATIDGYKAAVEGLQAKLAEVTQSLETAGKANVGTNKAEPGRRERESLLKLVIAMAMKKYNYKPKLYRNPAIANIANTLREYEISLDEDTIRKYLNEAKDLLKS